MGRTVGAIRFFKIIFIYLDYMQTGIPSAHTSLAKIEFNCYVEKSFFSIAGWKMIASAKWIRRGQIK